MKSYLKNMLATTNFVMGGPALLSALICKISSGPIGEISGIVNSEIPARWADTF